MLPPELLFAVLRRQAAVHDDLPAVGTNRHREWSFDNTVARDGVLLDHDEVIDRAEQLDNSGDLTEDDTTLGLSARIHESDSIAVNDEVRRSSSPRDLDPGGPVAAGDNIIEFQCETGIGCQGVSESGWPPSGNNTGISTITD